MTTRPLIHYVALTVTLLVVVLGAANWYAQPERAWAWAVAMLVLPIGWALTVVATRRQASTDERAARQGASALQTGITFAGLILIAGLGGRLLAGWLGTPGLEQRAAMVLVGAYLVFTGNSMPKMLVPLSSLQCDGSRAQAFQRMAGWIWVSSGLVFVVSWLVLPIALAKPVSLTVMFGGILVVASLAFRLHRTRRREA